MTTWIEAYDATCREAKQAMGINFHVDALVAIIPLLAKFGVDVIETGWPGANKAWDDLYRMIADGTVAKPANVQLVAFGSTRRAKMTVQNDELFQKLLAAPVDGLTVFGKCWTPHVELALQTSKDNNLQMVKDSIRAIHETGKRACFDAEHFVQGYLTEGDGYAFNVLEAAIRGGADTLVLCDTNGVAYPWDIEKIIAHVIREFGEQAVIGTHFHGDRGLDVANTVVALRAGARHFQGTVNGYSERVRMACTIEVMANLELLHREGRADWVQLSPQYHPQFSKQLSCEVDHWAGVHSYHRKPFVGRCCSTHKAGVHVSAGRRAGYYLYESHNPEIFGRRRHVVVSGMAGKANVVAFAKAAWGLDLDETDPLIPAILAEIETKEDQGYSFDACIGSAVLLVGRKLWPNGEVPQFNPLNYHVRNAPHGLPGEMLATIEVGDDLPTGRGDGPVDALANTAIKYLLPSHSCLGGLHLDDYYPEKLRVPGKEGTDAVMRVQIDWEHPEFGSFTTQGVSGNIINASWEAVVEAIVLVLLYQWRKDNREQSDQTPQTEVASVK